MKITVEKLLEVEPQYEMRRPFSLNLKIHMLEYRAEEFLAELLEEYGVEFFEKFFKSNDIKINA